MKTKLTTLLMAALMPLCAINFTGCAAQLSKLSPQTQAQLTAIQKKAYDLAMSWLDRWLGGLGGPASASRSIQQSPEDQFIAQNKVTLQSKGISEEDARVGFRAAQLQKNR